VGAVIAVAVGQSYSLVLLESVRRELGSVQRASWTGMIVESDIDPTWPIEAWNENLDPIRHFYAFDNGIKSVTLYG
jgi:hypothetical protein